MDILREVSGSTDGEPGANETQSAAHLLSSPKRRGNRYLDVEERLEAQKRFYHERDMRNWRHSLDTQYVGFDRCYFIGSSSGLIKIGFSKSPFRRLRELRRDTLDELTMLATESGGQEREMFYHTLFAEHHRGGEWFERHPDILAEIERLSA